MRVIAGHIPQLNSDHLAIYVNDHRAGATGGVELARRLVTSNARDDRFGPALKRLCAEIEADRASLDAIATELDISLSKVKPAAGWIAEKLGRLKVNGQLRGYSPLSRVVELEALHIGITGKLQLWRTLEEVVTPARITLDLEGLRSRAIEQREQVEGLQRLAVQALEVS